MQERTLKKRIQDSLLGVQLGDTLGMPVEIMTYEEILEATGGRGVTGLMDAIQRKVPDTRGLKAGDTTDDWQLTQVVAESLIACRGYDQDDQARRHIAAMRASRFGWGKTTQMGIESLIAGRSPYEPPDELGRGKGCGNGVAMKIAPIAHFRAARTGRFSAFPLLDEVMRHGMLTHPDIRAAIAAYALASALLRILTTPPGATEVERRAQASTLLQGVIDDAAVAEEEYNDTWGLEDSVSWRIDRASGLLDDPDALRTVVGTSCFSLESVPFALATFVRHHDDMRAGLLEAVNAGGDTDTNAAMVGALIGANAGAATAADLVGNLHDGGLAAMRLGAALYRAARP